jgi:hypothetical protein
MLHMPNFDDQEEAIRIMQQVRRILEANLTRDTGDEVIIHLPSTMGTVILKQRDPVSCTGELVEGLRSVLGTQAVVVA